MSSIFSYRFSTLSQKKSFIIRHHCSLYNELGKDVLFSSMYGRFTKLKNLDKAKYMRILGKISYCSGTGTYRWKVKVRRNVFDGKTGSGLKQKNPQSQKVRRASKCNVKKYKGNGGELLRFRRNGHQHLSDHSVVDQSTIAPATAVASLATTKQVGQPGSCNSVVSIMVEVYGPEDT